MTDNVTVLEKKGLSLFVPSNLFIEFSGDNDKNNFCASSSTECSSSILIADKPKEPALKLLDDAALIDIGLIYLL